MSDSRDSGSGMAERIIPIWTELVEQLLYVEDITEQLGLNGLLLQHRKERILHQLNTRTDMNRELLEAIQQREGAFDIFGQCLRVSGQDELYQLMDSRGHVEPVPSDMTTLTYRLYCKHGKGEPRQLNVPPHLQLRLHAKCDVLQGMENIEKLLDLMKGEGCLTTEMANVIQEQPNDRDMVKMLVDHIVKSTLYIFFMLVKFLDMSQQKDLLQHINEEDTKKALDCMDGLLLEVYFNLLGCIALKDNELEERLGVTVRDFVTLSINDNSKAVERLGAKDSEKVKRTGRSNIELVDLFCDQKENKKATRKVLLIGAPGAGKTTAIVQLAREAIAKRATKFPRPPFLIQLRSIDWTTETTLKNLLLCCGPTLTASEEEQVWGALLKHSTDVTIILDGADEAPPGFLDFKVNPVAGTEQKASPKHIFNNLILGKLLKDARVLVSSRPFGLEQCWSLFDRKVEVIGFNNENLNRFLKNELSPNHFQEVQKLLKNRIDIRLLLLIPLHAASFVFHAQNIEDDVDLLLQSHTELSMSLIDSLVKTECKKEDNGIVEMMKLRAKGSILRKICKYVAGMLISQSAIQIEITEEKLEEAGISRDECLATGLFSEKIVVTNEVSERIFIVPHQSILESLAALALDESQIMTLIKENDGRYDLVLLYVVGVFVNKKNTKMLTYLLNRKDYDIEKLTTAFVPEVLRSKRRLLKGGELFCQQIVVESQQWEMIDNLVRVMERTWFDVFDHEGLMVANQLIRHDPGKDTNNPLIRVEVWGIENMEYCPRATAVMQLGEVMAAEIDKIVEHLNNVSTIGFRYNTILSPFFAPFTRETVKCVISKICRLSQLQAVCIIDSAVGSSSDDESSCISCLSSIQSLKYLKLSCCNLSSVDVVAITSSCRRLRHLDISGNCGIQGKDVRSSGLTGLNVAMCGMEGDDIVEMTRRNGPSLEFLKALNSHHVLSSSHIIDLLNHCPQLVELYVNEGGELVRALSKRRAPCRLSHLWLRQCYFESCCLLSCCCFPYNSFVIEPLHVLPSILRDVLTNNPSITSLTLHGCVAFTSDLMHHLSSSMDSITSIFISPNSEFALPPLSSDVVSLIQASPVLTQLWLNGFDCKWLKVIYAINASPALKVVGLDVSRVSVDNVRDVIGKLTRPLTQLWLMVDDEKKEEYAEVALEGGPGVIHLTSDMYAICEDDRGLFYKHLPSSLPEYTWSSSYAA